jgi:hypothetical protein
MPFTLTTTFPDFKVSIEEILQDGNKVIGDWARKDGARVHGPLHPDRWHRWHSVRIRADGRRKERLREYVEEY